MHATEENAMITISVEFNLDDVKQCMPHLTTFMLQLAMEEIEELLKSYVREAGCEIMSQLLRDAGWDIGGKTFVDAGGWYA